MRNVHTDNLPTYEPMGRVKVRRMRAEHSPRRGPRRGASDSELIQFGLSNGKVLA